MTVYYKIQQILLQNATTILLQYYLQKCDRSLLQNALGFLLQNATFSLQNATAITNCNDFITKCDSYYKIQRLLQIATVQLLTQVLKKKQCFYEII